MAVICDFSEQNQTHMAQNGLSFFPEMAVMPVESVLLYAGEPLEQAKHVKRNRSVDTQKHHPQKKVNP